RPGEAALIVVLLRYAREQSPYADAVRAHDDRPGLALGVEEVAAHGLAVPGAQLEDVAHLAPARCAQRAATFGAGIALLRRRDVGYDVCAVVPAVVYVQQVVALLVGSCDQVWRFGDYVIHDHDCVPP